MSDLLVHNGTLITAVGSVDADILCRDGRIEALAAPGTITEAEEFVDASGLLVFPGFIDAHVHSRDPGLTDKEDFAHSTLAAAHGGVTTVLEMPNSVPPVIDVTNLAARRAHLEAHAHVDFGMWAMALGEPNLTDLPSLFDAGVVGAKVFWGYALDRSSLQLTYTYAGTEAGGLIPPPDVAAVGAILQTAAENGGLVGAHCENRDLILAAERHLGGPISTYADLLTVRSEATEASAIAVALELVRATGARFHVVHLSSARGADLVREAKRDGLPVTTETCPQYLFLSDESYATSGPAMKVYPPIRDKVNQAALVRAVNDGTIDIVASDHAPHTEDEKAQGLDRRPAGIIGTETLVPLMADAMLAGTFSPARLRWALSEGPARVFGLFPQKGTIAIGSDADLTILDPTGRSRVRRGELHSKNPSTPWDGLTLKGRIRAVVLRGTVIIREGRQVADPRGRFVPAHAWAGPRQAG